MNAANPAIGGIWASMSSWFTPTVLFCLLNLMIGTIFLTSNFKSHKNHQPPQQSHPDDNPHNPTQLVRAPSVLDRVKSMNFSLYRSDSLDQFQQYQSDPVQTQLVRAPSILDRVRTFNFSPYGSDSHGQFQHHDVPVQTQLVRAPSILERVRSFNFSPYRSDSQGQFQHHDEPVQTQLVRAPSILERVRSFNFSPYGSDHTEPTQHEETTHDPGHETHDHHVARSMSDTTGEDEGHPGAAAVVARMRKSASEKMMTEEVENVVVRRPATVREGKKTAMFGEDEEVDEKADDFINKFRQQLKLQRLDSLLRYKEMLTRGR